MSTNDKDNKDNKLQVEPDEKHLLLDHDYDGIQELNHPLPKWWNIIFYVSIVFGIGYFVYYQFLGGPTANEDLNVAMEKIKVIQEEYKKSNSQFNQEKFITFNVKENLEKGLKVYSDNCVQCHLENGIGDIGPNLTDDHWLVSKGTPETNYDVIYKGSEANGMPAWGEVLSTEDIYFSLVYLDSIRNTFVKGKAPEGIKVE